MIRVLLGTDSWYQAQRIEALLAGEPRITLIGRAYDGPDLVRLASTTPADVAVLHVDHPELGMLATCRQLLGASSPPGIVIVTSREDEELGRRALAAGASAYVVLRETESEGLLLGAVRGAARGNLVVDRTLRRLIGCLAARAPTPAERAGLTARELEMLPLLAEGHRNKELAVILGVSPQTVRNHLSRMYRKLGAGNRTQMIAEARRRRILE